MPQRGTALRGGAAGGQVTTKPMSHTGQRLLLNYKVKKGGMLTLEVLDTSGNVIGKSQPLSGDAVDASVAWQRDPKLGRGIVLLRFTLKNADVYSFRFD